MEETLDDKEKLRELYVRENKTKTEIAELFDSYREKVASKLNKFGLKKPWKQKELMEKLYCKKKLSTNEIAEKFNTSQSNVHRWLKEHNIETRASPREKSPYHYWDGRGYEIVSTDNGKERKQVYIHRLVAVAEFGIREVFDKDVHHINGVVWDNRPSNLEVISKEEHGRKHREEQINQSQ